jgi:hypothetical protein
MDLMYFYYLYIINSSPTWANTHDPTIRPLTFVLLHSFTLLQCGLHLSTSTANTSSSSHEQENPILSTLDLSNIQNPSPIGTRVLYKIPSSSITQSPEQETCETHQSPTHRTREPNLHLYIAPTSFPFSHRSILFDTIQCTAATHAGVERLIVQQAGKQDHPSPTQHIAPGSFFDHRRFKTKNEIWGG